MTQRQMIYLLLGLCCLLIATSLAQTAFILVKT